MGTCNTKQQQRHLKIDWQRRREEELDKAFGEMEFCDNFGKQQIVMKIFKKFNSKVRDEHIDEEEFLTFLKYAMDRNGQHAKARALTVQDALIMIRKITGERRNYLTKMEFLQYLRSL